jgi:hypothetical protein
MDTSAMNNEVHTHVIWEQVLMRINCQRKGVLKMKLDMWKSIINTARL